MQTQSIHKSLLKFSSLAVLLCLFQFQSFAQITPDSLCLRTPHKLSFLEPAPTLNKGRTGAFVGGITGIYAGALVGLDYLWYRGYARSKFHLFNDMGEWNQMDKCGHAQTAYFEGLWAYHILRWSGVKKNKAAIYGGLTGFMMQTTIEIMDGLSAKWGFSLGDIGANFIGATMMTWQEIAWGEQRIQLKFSPHIVNYPQGQLENRARNLYGSNYAQTFLKDYNAQTYWLSVNPASFNPKQKHARWINIAIGYGAGNMYGGFENKWTDENGQVVDRTDVKRYRRFFISFDADFTKIPTRTRTGKFFLGMLNTLKLPAPAIEFNTLGQVVFHPCFFLNWEVPLYLKK